MLLDYNGLKQHQRDKQGVEQEINFACIQTFPGEKLRKALEVAFNTESKAVLLRVPTTHPPLTAEHQAHANFSSYTKGKAVLPGVAPTHHPLIAQHQAHACHLTHMSVQGKGLPAC
eukprot:1147056-Pelagomonas_calceolata.AAC.2